MPHCDAIQEQLQLLWNKGVQVRQEEGSCVVVLPFKDHLGDLVDLRVRSEAGKYTLDDYGRIAGLLFSTDQARGQTRASGILRRLADAYGLNINKDEGLLELTITEDEFPSKFLTFTKVLLTLGTILPSMVEEGAGELRRESLGPRVSRRIRSHLKSRKLLDKVNSGWTVDGQAIPNWIVDYFYQSQHPANQNQHVCIITLDLAVMDPLPKAERALSMSLDIKAIHRQYDICVAYDGHGQNGKVQSATNLIRQHQLDAGEYKAFDMFQDTEKGIFFERIERELTSKLIL